MDDHPTPQYSQLAPNDNTRFINTDYQSLSLSRNGSHQSTTELVNASFVIPTEKTSTQSRRLQRHLVRAALNVIGPILVLGLYMFIVFEYIERPQEHGVSPRRVISAEAVFFAWVILSIFLLEWARSTLAGFEAAALMKPSLAPRTASQLMWHKDMDWSSIAGWWHVFRYAVSYVMHKFGRRGYSKLGPTSTATWQGPGRLWWYLNLTTTLFYVAVPLSGLSMNPGDSLERQDRFIDILGANASTFGARANSEVSRAALNGWMSGKPASPPGATVFYAPAEVQNASDVYYDDAVQSVYAADLAKAAPSNRSITFFSGPRVAERAYGRAWGLLTTTSCRPVNIYTGLELMNISSYDTWKIPGADSSFWNDSTSYATLGLSPASYFADRGFGMNFTYFVASDHDVSGIGNPDYTNSSINTLPIRGSFEFAVWQSILEGYQADSAFAEIEANPLVEKSDDQLGYGVHCDLTTDVGTAILSSERYTYNAFNQTAATYVGAIGAASSLGTPLFEWAGGYALQTVILSSLTGIIPGYFGQPTCTPSLMSADSTCNAFYGANVATGGIPVSLDLPDGITSLRQPSITPERMTLAMYKIVGEAADAVMATGPGNWTGELKGYAKTSDLTGGFVPWQIVAGFLGLWVIMTVLPQLWVGWERRWAARLDGEQMFLFGVSTAQQLAKGESVDLKQVPGMIGDLHPQDAIGQIGLSRYRARTSKQYSDDVR
jgi:hypothetical protein